jgi:hypothetical protein
MAKNKKTKGQKPYINGQTIPWPKEKNKRTEAVNRWTDNTMAKRKKNKRTEAVNRWTDNTMAKRKKSKRTESVNRWTENAMADRKRTNNNLQNIHIKLKIE